MDTGPMIPIYIMLSCIFGSVKTAPLLNIPSCRDWGRGGTWHMVYCHLIYVVARNTVQVEESGHSVDAGG